MSFSNLSDEALREAASRIFGEDLDSIVESGKLFGRNHNVVLQRESGEYLFVKKLRDLPGVEDRFSSCIAAQRTLVTDKVASVVPAPRLIATDEENHLLIYEHVNGQALPFALKVEEYPREVWQRVGLAVSAVHCSEARVVPAQSSSIRPEKTIIQLLNGLDFEAFWNLSGAEIDVWSILHSRREVLLGVDTFLDSKSYQPIHGDLRLDQFMIDGQRKLWLCDWDEFCMGDPAQDLGMLCGDIFLAFLQQGLQTYAQSAAVKAAVSDNFVRTNLGVSARNARHAISALSTAYVESLTKSEIVDGSFYTRSGWFFIWHIIERIATKASLRTHATAIDKAVLGICLAMVTAPEESMVSVGLGHV